MSILIFTGGSMFIHAFGAYFGVMVGITSAFRNYTYSEEKQGTTATTDVFSLLGNTKYKKLFKGIYRGAELCLSVFSKPNIYLCVSFIVCLHNSKLLTSLSDMIWSSMKMPLVYSRV